MSVSIERVKELMAKYHYITMCKQRIALLSTELDQKAVKLQGLRRKVDAEFRDIEKLEEFTFSSLFSTLLPRKAEALEKERQEYLLAVVEYRECKKVIDLIQYEIDVLEGQIKGKEGYVLKDLERVIFAIPEEELIGESIYLDTYRTVMSDIKKLFYLEIEIDEARSVVTDLLARFQELEVLLSRAQAFDNWGYTYMEKQIAKEKKQQHIDKTQESIYLIRKLALILQDELSDVQQYKEAFRRSEAYIQGFNMQYYKDLLADWLENESFDVTVNHTRITREATQQLKGELVILKGNVSRELKAMEARKAEVVQLIVDGHN